MKTIYKQSIKAKIEHEISFVKSLQGDYEIDYILLTETEYIQFLEEISPTDRILLTVGNQKVYKGCVLKVAPSR